MHRISGSTRSLGIVMVVAVLWQQASAKQGSQSNGIEDMSQVLMELQRQEDEAEMKRDAVTLDRLLADNFFTMDANGKVAAKADYIARFSRSDATNPNATFDYADVMVHSYGDMAVVNYRATFRYPARVNEFRVTVVWVKQGNAWKTATFHYSVLP